MSESGTIVTRDLRSVRDDAIAAMEEDERRNVAAGLAVAADCAYDDRGATPFEQARLEAVLALPVPEKDVAEYRRSRRHFSIGASEPILSGRPDATASAIRLVGLTDETARTAARLAGRVSLGAAETLIAEITRAGFGHEVTSSRLMAGAFEAMQRVLRENDRRDDRLILDEALVMSSVRATPPVRAWRLAAAAALFEVLEPGRHAVGTATRAVDRHPDLVRHLVRMAVGATGYPVDRTADEAARALALLDADRLNTAILLHLAADPLRETAPATPATSDADLPVLRSCLTSANDWLFWLAAEWLAESGDQGVSELWDALPEMAPLHRGAIAGWVADALRRPEAYAHWLDGSDPMLRLVGAHGMAEQGRDRERINPLAGDRDRMVRLEVLRTLSKAQHPELFETAADEAFETAPEIWTCRWCGSLEDITAWDCTSCSAGDRPDLNEEVRRLRK
ncbi:MAG: hypothetical protein ACRD07_06735 [Acidimicrobiales bacterium]